MERFESLPARKVALILASLGLCTFLFAIEETIVATSVNTIAKELSITGSMTWITGSYLLAVTAFQPITGRLSDVVGKKTLLLTGLWIFMIGNVISGTSKGLQQLVAGRLISGVGGATMMSLPCIIISDMTHERQRGSYFNLINAVFVLSDAIGPFVGAAFAQKASWRWIFLFNVPFGVVVTLVLACALRCPPPSVKITSWTQITTKVDFWGMITLIASLTLFVVGLNLGGQARPWNSSTIIGLLVGAGIAFIVFVGIEKWVAINPVVPIFLFSRWDKRNVPIMVVVRTMLFFHLFAMVFYLPIFFALVKQYPPILSAALIIPFLTTSAIASTLSGLVASKWGHVRPVFLASQVILPVGMGLVATLNEHTPLGAIMGYSLICGVGFGAGTQVSLLIAQTGLEPELVPTVTAVVSTVPSLGAILGVTIIGVIVNSGLKAGLLRGLPPGSSPNINDPLSLVPSGVSPELVASAYSHGFRNGFYTLAGVAAVQFILCLFLKRVVLNDGTAETEAEKPPTPNPLPGPVSMA